MDDESLLQQFENGSLPAEKWHHREHVKVAYLFLRRHPLPAAIERIRSGLQAFNAAQNIPYTLDRGYHETMTLAWMKLVHFTLCEYGPAESADQFYDQHPQLWQMKVLRFFYSRDRLMSWEAKRNFAEPDILPLPKPRNS
jgi:hypothetical protein